MNQSTAPPDPIQAVLFDFDGVLVDSEPVRFKAGAQALAEIGVTLSWERFVRFWLGRTDEAGLQDILGDRFAAEGAGVAARRNALYEAHLDAVPAFPDAVRLARRVPAALPLAVVTGSRRTEVTRILDRLEITGLFPVIVTAEDYAHAKPAPDPFLAAAGRLGVTPAACLVIEDTRAGVAAACAAGMRVVAVDRGRGAVRLDGATWRVSSLDAIGLTPNGEVVVKAPPPAAGGGGHAVSGGHMR
jgi:beta-phosphoglucomutase